MIICFGTINSFAQSNVTTFGVQYKPILSSETVNTGPQTNKVGDIGFTIEPKNGYSFGMVVRKGFTDQISLETGINFTKRKYNLRITEDSTGFVGESKFSYTIYEIPVLGLIYVQLGKQTYLNTAFGLSLDFLPSDWDTFDNYFEHYSEKKYWVVPSLLANIGFEYRTPTSGFLYLGFSYHRPFSEISTAGVRFLSEDEFGNIVERERTFFKISGNYLTLDFRYFFHEDPDRKKRRR